MNFIEVSSKQGHGGDNIIGSIDFHFHCAYQLIAIINE